MEMQREKHGEGGIEGVGRWEYCKAAASGYKSVAKKHKETQLPDTVSIYWSLKYKCKY